MTEDPYATGQLKTSEIQGVLDLLDEQLRDLPAGSPERGRVIHHRDALLSEQSARQRVEREAGSG
jgi:hypothetical protein